jgi:hypothetical protein
MGERDVHRRVAEIAQKLAHSELTVHTFDISGQAFQAEVAK